MNFHTSGIWAKPETDEIHARLAAAVAKLGEIE